MSKLEFVKDDVVVAVHDIPIEDENKKEKMVISEGSVGRLISDNTKTLAVAGFKVDKDFISVLLFKDDIGLVLQE